MSVVYPLGDFVTANTGIAASKDDAHAVLLAIQVFLRQVTVGGRLAHDNNGVTFVHALDGLVVTGDNGQHIVCQHEVGRADLMTLGSHNDRSAIELTGVAHVVQVFFRLVTQRSDIQIADCLLGADNSSSLATGSGLNMINQVEQIDLIVCTGTVRRTVTKSPSVT